MKVQIGLSNHHVHLSNDDFKILFPNKEMKKVRNINQPGQFVSNLKVDIKVNDKKIESLKVLGPTRNYTQVELMNKDCEYLNINCPVTSSGNLENAIEVIIISPYSQINRKCAIQADRHLHLTKEQQIKLNLENIEKVKLVNDNLVIDDVYLRVAENSYFEVHLDKEDGEKLNVISGDYFKIERYK